MDSVECEHFFDGCQAAQCDGGAGGGDSETCQAGVQVGVGEVGPVLNTDGVGQCEGGLSGNYFEVFEVGVQLCMGEVIGGPTVCGGSWCRCWWGRSGSSGDGFAVVVEGGSPGCPNVVLVRLVWW